QALDVREGLSDRPRGHPGLPGLVASGRGAGKDPRDDNELSIPMIVSWNWLTDYLRLDMPVETLGERLALTGLNFDGLSDVGGDIAIDLEVTSNRPDCLGHIGVAREIAVVVDKPLS